MSDFGEGLFCSGSLYPIVQDLDDVKFSSDISCNSPPANGGGSFFGCFDLQELAFPALTPIPMLWMRQQQKKQDKQQNLSLRCLQKQLQENQFETQKHDHDIQTHQLQSKIQQELQLQQHEQPKKQHEGLQHQDKEQGKRQWSLPQQAEHKEQRKESKMGQQQPDLKSLPSESVHRRSLSATRNKTTDADESSVISHRRKLSASSLFHKITHRRSSSTNTESLAEEAQSIVSASIENIGGSFANELEKPGFHYMYVLTRQVGTPRI